MKNKIKVFFKKKRWIKEAYCNNGSYCALGFIYKTLGAKKMGINGIDQEKELKEKAGFTSDTAAEIIEINDNGPRSKKLRFEEIKKLLANTNIEPVLVD